MEESISTPMAGNTLEGAGEVSSSEPKPGQRNQVARKVTSSKSESRKLYEEAVENAQYVMAYASSKCTNDIDETMVGKLIRTRRRIENNEEITAEEETEFWMAYQDLWNLVRPLSAECIRATEGPKARKTMYWHIGFTFIVLFLLLILQIYWVVGNQLTTRLADLLQRETELSQKISDNQQEYSTIELRFKQNEIDSQGFQGSYNYTFSPEFERDTAENLSERAKLDTELVSFTSQRDRNNAVLLLWSTPWYWLIDPTLGIQENEIKAEIDKNTASIQEKEGEISGLLVGDQSTIKEASKKIKELETELEQLRSNPEENAVKISEKEYELNDAYYVFYTPDRLQEEIQNLEKENQQLNNQIIQERSRQTQLPALFVLTILQGYLLPLLYGLLGASTSSLRSLSREIDQVIFSDKRRIQHMLRIALGALSGIMVGWFSFLYEGTTLLGSVPPLAIAFIVGYNIDLFFNLMDRAIDTVKKAGKATSEEQAPISAISNQVKDKPQNDEQTKPPQEASAAAGS